MLVFSGLTFSGFLLSFTPSLPIYTLGCLLAAFCAGIGNGTIFKLVPLYFSKQAGIVNGIVAAMGGLGGFFPPLVLTALLNLTGHYAIGFMALSEFALASLIIVIELYYQDKLTISERIIESTVEGIMVTENNKRKMRKKWDIQTSKIKIFVYEKSRTAQSILPFMITNQYENK